MPVYQTENVPRGQTSADQEHACHQKHIGDVRQPRAEKGQKHRGSGNPLGNTEAIHARYFNLAIRDNTLRQFAPPDEPDAAKHRDERKGSGWSTRRRETPEIEPSDLADQNVLWIANDGGGRAGIRRASERDQVWTRIKPAPG